MGKRAKRTKEKTRKGGTINQALEKRKELRDQKRKREKEDQ
jgi:hypothetical protein